MSKCIQCNGSPLSNDVFFVFIAFLFFFRSHFATFCHLPFRYIYFFHSQFFLPSPLVPSSDRYEKILFFIIYFLLFFGYIYSIACLSIHSSIVIYIFHYCFFFFHSISLFLFFVFNFFLLILRCWLDLLFISFGKNARAPTHTLTHQTVEVVTEAAATSLPSPSLDYDGFDTISSELYDLDTEQSQARYDPKQLNVFGLPDVDATEKADDNYNGDGGEEKNGDGAHCLNGNKRYEHGEKVKQQQLIMI